MIKIDDLCRYYMEGFPIDRMSYTFESGKRYVLRGPSGCGKTTLLRMIGGIERIDSGTIYKGDVLIGESDYQMHPTKRGIGMVFQSPALWPHMSVKKQIGFGTKDNARVEELIAHMQLQPLVDKYPGEISGGEAKRVALARMLAVDWKYLLLDEPLTNIDSALKSELMTYIDDYVKKNNTTLIYVTHNEDEAARIDGEHIEFKRMKKDRVQDE